MSYSIFNLFNAKAYKYTRKNDNDIINNNNNSKDNKLDKKNRHILPINSTIYYPKSIQS